MLSSSNNFTLEDFRNQLEKFLRPGLIQRLIELMPGMGQIREMQGNADAVADRRRLIGIINSMTQPERRKPKMIELSRRRRIAKGAGVETEEVTALVKQYQMMKPLVAGIADTS